MSKTVLVFAANSFIGNNLINHIKHNSNYSICATSRIGGKFICPTMLCDINNLNDVKKVISSVKPEIIFNCAGISSFEQNEKDHFLSLSTNTIAIENILQSVTKYCPKSKFINLGSIYELEKPNSYYSLSKKAARLIIEYYQQKNINCYQLFLSNVIGKNQDANHFVVPKIIKFARLIKENKAKFIELGNLDSEIKLLEIGEAVELIWDARNYELVDLIIEGNTTIKIKDLVKFIFNRLDVEDWEKYIKIDKNLVRPETKNIEHKIIKVKGKKNLGDIIENLLE